MGHWLDRVARSVAGKSDGSRRDLLPSVSDLSDGMPRLDRLSRQFAASRVSRRQAIKVMGASAAVVGVAGLRPTLARADCTGGCGSTQVTCNTSDGDCNCCDPRYFTTTPQCCTNFSPMQTAVSPCCESTQECCVYNVTLVDGTTHVANGCCDPSTETCVVNSNQGCCPNAQVCGSGCCESYQTCVNGVCCDTAACGDTCCPDDQKCCLHDTGKAVCCPQDATCMEDGSCCPSGHKICSVGSAEICCQYECVGGSEQGPEHCCQKGEVPATPRNTNGFLEKGQVCCPPARLATFTGAQTCCPVGYVHQPGGGISVNGGPCCKATDVCGQNCCPSSKFWPTSCVKGDCWVTSVYQKHLALDEKNDAVQIPVTCEQCSGTATLQTSAAGSSAFTARVRRPVVLGTGTFKTGKHHGTTTIKLSRTGRAYLRRHSASVTVQIKVTAKTGDGKTRTGLTEPSSLKLPKRQ
jgi:hypothetical protein